MKTVIDQPLGQNFSYPEASNTTYPVPHASGRNDLKVHLHLSVNDFQHCLPDFINKAISFEVTYHSNHEVKEIVTHKVRVSPSSSSPKKKESSESKKDSKMAQIYQKYIVENIEQIPPTDAQIAKEFEMSVPTFKNKFKMSFGKTFYQLYMDKKMEYAANLLRKGFRANEVSARMGYSQPIKFSMIFKKHFGITPKKFQMQCL
jgi:AraC-like DNA-binding protein